MSAAVFTARSHGSNRERRKTNRSYIQDREAAVLTRIATARKRTQEWRVGSGMQRTAQTTLYREMEELDRLHRASKSVMANYREQFVKCSSCQKTFHDEVSFLAHWRYGLSGAIQCVKATSLLQAQDSKPTTVATRTKPTRACPSRGSSSR